MNQLWVTYLFLIGFLFMIEFGVSRAFRRPFNLRKTLINCAGACIGLTVYYLILAA